MASERTQNVHELLYKYLLTLKIDAQQYQKHSNTPLGVDIFSLPNKGAFLYVTYFLFDKFDHSQCKKEFEFLWPIFNKKQNSDFLKAAYNWLSSLASKNPEARIPKFTMSLFTTSSGDKLCSIYLAFAMFILQRSMKRQRNVTYLHFPNLSVETKRAASVVHSVMYENLLLQKDQLARSTKEAHESLTDCAFRSTDRHRELKNSIKSHETRLEETNKELCEKMGEGVIADSLKKLDYENEILLSSVRTLWQQTEENYNAICPSKAILLAGLNSSDKSMIDGSRYPVKVSPNLIAAIRTQIEKENLFTFQEGRKLNLEKLVKFFTITLASFDQTLKGMESVLNVNEILPHQEQLKKESEKVLQYSDEIESETIPSFVKIISEQEKLLSTFNVDPEPVFIDGNSYFLQQATPELKSRPSMNGNLNDSAYSVLMNVSSANLLESPTLDSSPELRRRLSSSSVTSASNIPTRTVHPFKLNLPKINLTMPAKPNKEFNFSSPFKKPDPVETVSQNVANKRKSIDDTFARIKLGALQVEDLFFGTSCNASFSPSLRSYDSFNVSLLENQTLDMIDITSELDASNALLELSD